LKRLRAASQVIEFRFALIGNQDADTHTTSQAALGV
jgi:hypothetical protein